MSSAADFVIKVGSTANVLDITCQDAAGAPVSIQGATLTWIMSPVAGGAVKVNNAASNLDDGTTPNRGKARYSWVAGDIDTPGQYYGELKVTYTNGKTIRFPEDGHVLVEIVSALA